MAKEKTAPESAVADFRGCGWEPFFASIVPASRRRVLKMHCGGIGLRDGNRGQTRSMMWYFCGDRAGRRVKEMVVELYSFRVKEDALKIRLVSLATCGLFFSLQRPFGTEFAASPHSVTSFS